ncbi:MAG: ABC transporter permease [Fimbriimonas sp.]|nr:ABC transporter permease [Fimbriimonas sp.]
MGILEYFRLAIRALKSNKMRTALTMLGISIGVAVTILVVAIGEGATKSVADQVNGMGTNLLTVHQGPREMRLTAAARTAPTQSQNTLTLDDADMVMKLYPDTIAAVAPQVRGSIQIRLFGANATSSVLGTTPSYLAVNNQSVRKGRFFTSMENESNLKVCVLGSTAAENLTGNANADLTGQNISVNRDDYLVVGMLTTKGTGQGGQDPDDVVIIPVSTAMQRVLGVTGISDFSISCVSPELMTLAQQEVTSLLRQRHHLQPPFPQNDDFRVANQTDLLARSESVTKTMTTLLTAVAVISLIVGGIGIMNVMLMSVKERTREIGIRKAIGARSRDILMQFLTEASIISILGGLQGVLLGVVGALLLASFGGWNAIVSPTALVIALVVSASVGIFFGIHPAQKAASMHPIDALRYE